MASKEYQYEDLFHVDKDSGETILTIPPELLKEKGWDEGTKLKIEVGDMGTLILTEIT
jgi:hypothetical protein|tara:strand:+ start:18552 stop:18725 length:174 start_codon:yes stop_codon:yes gene_type:complete